MWLWCICLQFHRRGKVPPTMVWRYVFSYSMRTPKTQHLTSHRAPPHADMLAFAPIPRSFQSQPIILSQSAICPSQTRIGAARAGRGARACALRSVRVRSCVRLRGWPFITANRCRGARAWHTHSFAATERECPSPETASDRVW